MNDRPCVVSVSCESFVVPGTARAPAPGASGEELHTLGLPKCPDSERHTRQRERDGLSPRHAGVVVIISGHRTFHVTVSILHRASQRALLIVLCRHVQWCHRSEFNYKKD